MADFVINEWIWADASGDNNRERQRQAYKAITSLAVADHRIVIIEGSPFDRKAWIACKSTDTIIRLIARAYVTGLRQDSRRCVILKPDQTAQIPKELESAIKPDDHYLVRAQMTCGGAIVVTTDGPLRDTLTNAGLPCLFREEFLSRYQLQ